MFVCTLARNAMKIGREALVVFIVAVTVSAITIGLSFAFWDWLTGYTLGIPLSEIEPPSTTVRNIVLGLAAVIALLVAVWRGWVADRQATIADRRATIADGQWQNERYLASARMLESPSMAVRLGAIYQLRQIAHENPERFHIPVMDLICAFIRTPPESIGVPGSGNIGLFSHVPKDLAAALEAFSERGQLERKAIEKETGFWMDLSGACLSGADLMVLDFSGVRLSDVDFTGAVLHGTDLSSSYMPNVILIDAELLDVDLRGADMSFSLLFGADFTNAKFENASLDYAEFLSDGDFATGLTQAQIDDALATAGAEPNLEGLFDSETGQPLVWNDKTT